MLRPPFFCSPFRAQPGRRPWLRAWRAAAHAVALLSLCAGSHLAVAADYPARSVQLVVPFPAGGSIDVLGRLLSRELGARLGQPWVVENKAGAGTAIGAQQVARTKPDGYTLLLSSNSTYTLLPATSDKLAFDPVENFEPVAMVANVALVLLAHPQEPARTLQALVAQAKATPSRYVYGSFGSGTSAHFAGEMLNAAAGTQLAHVPYRGSAMALTDLMGGQIPLAIDTVVAAAPHITSGKIRPIAVTTAQRSASLPQVPTVAESGYAGFDMGGWIALVAPRGLPDDVKQRLGAALADTMGNTEVRKQLVAAGFEPAYAPMPQWKQQVGAETQRLRSIAQRIGITAH